MSYRGSAEIKIMEARVGFEPTNGGFADLSLGPLGYRAELFSIAKTGTRGKTLKPSRILRFPAALSQA